MAAFAVNPLVEVVGLAARLCRPAAAALCAMLNAVFSSSGEPMHDHTTIRAWKDADYRQMLSAEDAAAAQSPAGTIELDDGDLGDIAGGTAAVTQTTICGTSLGCVTVITLALSKNISCGACTASLWSGTCYASSVGCCP